ncbi:MAG TPA: hypothetical protein VMP68_23320, partial [Candidatus Eisenbacteria bacterium]|nr:hypothetical protein [Candidatus Eisenbacteria bacterium]
GIIYFTPRGVYNALLMGLFKDHFHWTVLLSWLVLAVTVPTILTLAGLLLFFDQYGGANMCFVIASLFIFAKFAHVAIISQDSVPQRLLFTFVLFGLLGIGIVETVRGVNKWALKREQGQPKSTNSASITEDISRTLPDAVTAVVGPPLPTSDFDSKPAEWRIQNKPDDLQLRDLFLTDFKAVQQKTYGAVFVDDAKKISVQYAIDVELSTRSKFLTFYVAREDQHTAEICEYLATHYQWILDNAPQLLVEQKIPGDSGTMSTKEAVFSKRIYIYHETYLPAGETVKLTSFYEKKGLSAIFRSTDYLSTKKMEANLLKLRKEQSKP